MSAPLQTLRLRWIALAAAAVLAGLALPLSRAGLAPREVATIVAAPVVMFLAGLLWAVRRVRARTGHPLGW